MNKSSNIAQRYVRAIQKSGVSIYDSVKVGDPNLWIPTSELELLLNESLVGTSLAGYPLRTRSKIVKELVAEALGYPIPSSFKKTKPRFLGQLLDIYIQKSNNLQVWNEELSSARRYAIIRVDKNDFIVKVKVVMGDTLATLDTTGTLTQKYQARLVLGERKTELITSEDTKVLYPFLNTTPLFSPVVSPVNYPSVGQLLPIAEIYKRLRPLIGTTFSDIGYDQERNRGAELHKIICQKLGYKIFQDDGRFPDIKHQLLEVKLQTSPTIDLGLVRPNSTEPIDIPMIEGEQIRHCDARYVLFFAETDGEKVTLTHIFLTTGERFFDRFPQFGGKVLNKKLQIPLPSNFFDLET